MCYPGFDQYPPKPAMWRDEVIRGRPPKLYRDYLKQHGYTGSPDWRTHAWWVTKDDWLEERVRKLEQSTGWQDWHHGYLNGISDAPFAWRSPPACGYAWSDDEYEDSYAREDLSRADEYTSEWDNRLLYCCSKPEEPAVGWNQLETVPEEQELNQ